VFAAFVDGAMLVRWLPPAGMDGTLDQFDPSPSGGFRMTLTYREPTRRGKFSADTDVSEVRIAELDPPRRIVWEVEFPSDDRANAGTMRMEWRLVPLSAGTEATVRVTGRAIDDLAGGSRGRARIVAGESRRPRGMTPTGPSGGGVAVPPAVVSGGVPRRGTEGAQRRSIEPSRFAAARRAS
jgi:uncharacterized protein YndB with AHSA1/START domain